MSSDQISVFIGQRNPFTSCTRAQRIRIDSLLLLSRVPRHIDVPVKFKTKFTQKPVVVISTSKLDWETGLPAGFDLTILETKKDCFTYRLSAVSPKMVYGVEVQFAAYSDPSIAVLEFATSDVGVLASGESKKRVATFPIQYGKPFESVPNVCIFLTGAQWIERNNIIVPSVCFSSQL